jgi:hypothetical protein
VAGDSLTVTISGIYHYHISAIKKYGGNKMQAIDNLVVHAERPSIKHQTHEIELLVLSSEDGFLVVDQHSGEEFEVQRREGNNYCSCFFALVAPESPCEHIRAVEGYLSIPDRKMQLSQAEADIFLSRVARIDDELTTDEQSGQEQIDRIQLWLESRKQQLEKRRSFYTFQLQSWMESNEYSSKQLVNGTLKMRKQPFQIEILDEGLVITEARFCRVIPEKQAVDKKALRKHITETGEIVDGVEVKSVQPKFSYQLTPGGS